MRIFAALSVMLALVAGSAADLIISEVHDGPLSGQPRWFEFTNTGPGTIADLSIYSVSIFGNGSSSVTAGPVPLAAVALAEGDSHVMAGDASPEFQTAYGFEADEYGAGLPPQAQNGDDTIVLHLTANDPTVTQEDTYGAIGVDGSFLFWEFLDSGAYRRAGVTAASATMVTSEWTVMRENDNDGSGNTELPLMSNPGVHNGHLLTLSTQRGTGDLDNPTPALTTAISAVDLVNSTPPTMGGIGLHGLATGGAAVFTDGATNAAASLDGLLADSGLNNASASTMSWTFAPPGVFVAGINSYCQNSGADSRVFQNCHIYLDLTDDATDNPTFYTEVAIGSNNDNNVTDANTWSAFYLGAPSGAMGGAAVHGIRLDYYATGAVGGDFAGEYDGEPGSVIKEVDILGVVAPVELSVFSSN